MSSAAANEQVRSYLTQWRNAASVWSRAMTSLQAFFDTVRSMMRDIPVSTYVASGIALILASIIALMFVRGNMQPIFVRRKIDAADTAREPPPRPPDEASASPPPQSDEPPPRNSYKDTILSESSRAGAAHQAWEKDPPRQRPPNVATAARRTGGGTKAVGIIVNFFFPGIGTMIVGRVGQGIAQFLLFGFGAALSATGFFAIIGLPLAFIVWIWALVSAATAADKPIVIVFDQRGAGS
jgi:TM2 domain-containing membrane protein YozV